MSKFITRRIRDIRTTRSQFEKMTDFMEKYPQLFHGIIGTGFQKDYKDKLWRDLADILNAETLGPKRPAIKWRKCFKDYKCYVKKKYLTYLADSSNLSPLTYLEVRMLALMGYVVDIEGMDYSNSDVQAYLLEEIDENLVTDVTNTTENIEQNQKFYQAPEIITLFPKDANSSPTEFENTPNKVMSPKKEDTPINEEAAKNVESSSDIEESPCIEESQCIAESPFIEESPSIEESPNKKSPNNKNLPTQKRKYSKISKNATAVALHAIAKELNMKNLLTKRKIEIEEEKLILEKRKVEAFELIAKRLQK